MRSLAGQAAVAVENNLLYESIERLFEGFVTAAVTAIEQRDPTTSGHSFRVADLTVELAQRGRPHDDGQYRDVRFTLRPGPRDPLRLAAARLRQSRRARAGAGQGEEALSAAARHASATRFEFAMKSAENDANRRKLEYLLEHGRDGIRGVRRAHRRRDCASSSRQTAEGLRLHHAVERADRAAGRGVPVPAAARGAEFDDIRGERRRLRRIRRKRASSPSARATSTPPSAARSRATSRTRSTSCRRSPGRRTSRPSPTSPTRITRSSTAAAIRAS